MTIKTLLCRCERLILLSAPSLYAMYLRIRCQTCIIQLRPEKKKKKGDVVRKCETSRVLTACRTSLRQIMRGRRSACPDLVGRGAHGKSKFYAIFMCNCGTGDSALQAT